MARQSSGWRSTALLIAAVALFLGGIIGLPLCCSHHADMAGAGRRTSIPCPAPWTTPGPAGW